MSILIQGMEMPKNCVGCPICCGLPYQHRDAKGRRPDCPLVEIPTPHGRLIDVSTVEEIRFHDADGYHVINGEQLCELEIEAETVIEAEGSKS